MQLAVRSCGRACSERPAFWPEPRARRASPPRVRPRLGPRITGPKWWPPDAIDCPDGEAGAADQPEEAVP
eukprot:5450451-Lingulodinium_polyedra.AAC.1